MRQQSEIHGQQMTRKLLTASIIELLEIDDVEQRCRWATTAPRCPLGMGTTVVSVKKREDQGRQPSRTFRRLQAWNRRKVGWGLPSIIWSDLRANWASNRNFDHVGHLSISPAHAASSCTPSRLPISKFPKVTIDKGLLHALRISDCGQSDDR